MGRTVPFAERHHVAAEAPDEAPEQPVILAPDGRPARTPPDALCPQCGAGADKRTPSSGFGTPHDVCSVCGWEFQP